MPSNRNVPHSNRIRGGAPFGLSLAGSANCRTSAVFLRTSSGWPSGPPSAVSNSRSRVSVAWPSFGRLRRCARVVAPPLVSLVRSSFRLVGLNWTGIAAPDTETRGGLSAEPFGVSVSLYSLALAGRSSDAVISRALQPQTLVHQVQFLDRDLTGLGVQGWPGHLAGQRAQERPAGDVAAAVRRQHLHQAVVARDRQRPGHHAGQPIPDRGVGITARTGQEH